MSSIPSATHAFHTTQTPTPRNRSTKSIHERFVDFHTANPEVYALFREYAWELKRRGFEAFSADAICHRIRYESALRKGPGETFKLSNDLVAWYSRMLIHNEPVFADFFTLRELRSTK